jgi:hypothetical protein
VTRLGALAIAFYAIHGLDQLRNHEPEDLLWACHVACLIIGLGCVAYPEDPARSSLRETARSAIGIGLSWLSVGIPLWVLDLATGGSFIPSSVLTHVGGLTIGAIALKQVGWPRRVWVKSVLAQCALMVLTRLVTPPRANVNLAFSVWQGWERYFPSYAAYFALLFVASALSFAAVEMAMRRVFVLRPSVRHPPKSPAQAASRS